MRSPLRSSRPAAWERRSRARRTSPSSWPYLKVRPEREWMTAVESGSWRETASKRGRRGRVESILAAGRSEAKGEVRDGTDEGGRRTAEERSDRRRDIVKPEREKGRREEGVVNWSRKDAWAETRRRRVRSGGTFAEATMGGWMDGWVVMGKIRDPGLER